MATQERKAQLKFAVDGAEVKSGVEQIKGDVRDMAQDVAKSGEQAAKGVGAIGRSLDDLGKKSAETSSKTAEGTERMDAAARKMQAALERQALALQTGVISVGKYNAAYYEGLAALRGYGDALAPTIARLREAEAASKTAADAQKRLAEQTQFLADIDRQAASIGKTQVQLLQERARALGVSDQAAASIGRLDAAMQRSGNTAAQTAAAMRGVPAQITDIITSLQGGQAPLTVFLQQGGQLRDMFGSTGAAARALGSTLLTGLANPAVIAGGAVLGLAAAYHTGSAEMDGYRAALVNSGNAAGVTAGQLQLYAQRIDGVIGTQAAAAAGLVEFVSAGVQGGEQLERFTRIAIGWEKATGTAVASVAKQFGDLDKDPLQAVLRLNESMNFLTDSTYGNIKALVEQGKTTEAAALAQKTFADVLEQRTAEVEKNLGTIEKSWRAVKNAIAEAIDAALGVGRMAGPEVQLEKQQALVTHLESELAKRKNRGLATGDYDAQLKAAKERLGILQEEVLTQQNQAALDGVRAENFKARLAWDEVVKANLSKQQKDEQEIARIRNLGLAAGKSDLEIQKAISAYRAKGNSSGGASALNDSLSAQVQAYKNADDQILKSKQKTLDQIARMVKAGTMGELDAAEESLEIENKAWAERQANFQAEIAQASKKKNAATEVARITGQMQTAEIEHERTAAKLRDDALAAQYKQLDVLEAVAKKAWAARGALLSQVHDAQQEAKEIGLVGDALGQVTLARIKDAAAEKERQAAFEQTRGNASAAEALREQARLMLENYTVAGNNAAARSAYEYGKAVRESSEALQFEINLMGLSSREREIALEQYRIEIDLRKKIEEIEARTAADPARRNTLLAQARSDAATAKANASSRVFLEDWKRSVQQYDDIFRQGFADMLNNGEAGWDSFTKSLATTFKTTVADQIYKAFLQPIVVNVVGNLMGMTGALGMLGGGGGGSGGAMGLLNGASTLNTAYNLFNGGIASSLGAGVTQLGTMFGNQAAMQFGMGMQGMYLPPGMMGPGVYSSTGAMGAAAGTAVGIGAGVLGGIYGGRLVSGGFSMSGNSSGNSAVNTGTAVGAAVGSIIPVIGTALGALIGGLLGGAFNRAFGYKLKDSGLEATLGSNAEGGSESRQYQFYKGGWFKSDKTEYSQTDPQIEKFLDDSVQAIRASAKSYADALSLPADALSTYSITLKESFKDLDEAEMKERLAGMLGKFGDGLAEALLGSVGADGQYTPSEFARDGETASETLQRLGGSLMATNRTFDTLGLSLFEASQQGGSLASSLIDQIGGLEQFDAATTAYFERYYSGAEQLAHAASAIGAGFDALDVAVPGTRAAFRELVGSLDLTTEAGQKTFAGLMGLAPAFSDLLGNIQASVGLTADAVKGLFTKALDGATSAGDAQQRAAAAASELIATAMREAMLNAVVGTISDAILAPLATTIVGAATSAAAIDVAGAGASAAALTAGGSTAGAAVATGGITAGASLADVVGQVRTFIGAFNTVMADPEVKALMKDSADALGEMAGLMYSQDSYANTNRAAAGGGGGGGGGGDSPANLTDKGYAHAYQNLATLPGNWEVGKYADRAVGDAAGWPGIQNRFGVHIPLGRLAQFYGDMANQESNSFHQSIAQQAVLDPGDKQLNRIQALIDAGEQLSERDAWLFAVIPQARAELERIGKEAFSRQEAAGFDHLIKDLDEKIAAMNLNPEAGDARLAQYLSDLSPKAREKYDEYKEKQATLESLERYGELIEERKALEKDLAQAMRRANGDMSYLTEGMTELEKTAWLANQAIRDQIEGWDAIARLRDDSKTLEVDLLRAQGDEAGAALREFAQATARMTDEQREAYRVQQQLNDALRAQIAWTQELPGVLDKFRTPEQRTAAQYDSIAGQLIGAGLGVDMGQGALAAALTGATKDEILELASALIGMGEISEQTRLVLVRTAGALADLKDAEQRAAEEAARAAEAQLKATQDWRASLGATLEGAYLQTLAPDAQVQYLRGKESSLWDALDGAEHPVDVAQKLQKTILERIGVEARLRAQVSQETLQGLQAQLGAAQSLKGALDSLRLGSDSALNPYEQLLYAGGKFDDAYKRALAGDVGAWADVQSFGQSYVKLGRENYASSTDAADIFFKVTGAMDELVAKGLAVEPQVQALQALGKTGEDQLWQAQQQVQALTRLDGAMQRQQERQQAQLDKLTGAADRQIEQLKEQNALLRAQIEQQAAIAREQREREGQILAELAAVRESARMAEAQTQ